MDLEVARKSLSKRSAFPKRKIAFAVATGLVLVAGIALRATDYFGEPQAGSEPAAVAVPSPALEVAPEAAPSPPSEATNTVPMAAAPAPS